MFTDPSGVCGVPTARTTNAAFATAGFSSVVNDKRPASTFV